MTRFWLTTHWPQSFDPRDGAPDAAPPEGVWVSRGKEAAASDLARGDRVLIYQTRTGPTPRGMRRATGAGGLIGEFEVVRRASQLHNERYTTGRSRTWHRIAITAPRLLTPTPVSRARVNRVLRYKPGNSMHGFGTDHSGLAQISPAKFSALRAALLTAKAASSRQATALVRKAARPGRHRARGGGGEGAAHRALKLAIAADPIGTLGIQGLRLVAVEHEFASGDRVDVLLRAANRAYVVVEVEPEVPGGGSLVPVQQAAKYRLLADIELARSTTPTVALIAAARIAPAASRHARRWNILCRAVALPSR